MPAKLRACVAGAILAMASAACDPIPLPPMPIAPASSPPRIEVTCAALGCPSDRSVACEAQPAADAIRADGYRLTCSPTTTPPTPLVQGMTDHRRRLVSVWPGSSEAQTIAVLWHEQSHVVAELRGQVFPTQAAEEEWAWGRSFCIDPQNGVGYPVRPTPAECQATYL